MAENDETRKQQREREALEEWLRSNRAETARRDLTDAAPQADRGTASDTQKEAIDRAAHIPGWHQQAGEERENRTPLFTKEEEKLLAQQTRDMAELYPTEEAYTRSFPQLAPPSDPEQQAQYDDMARRTPREKEATNMTPEQQASIDKALAESQISRDVGGASDVNSKPQPNDPRPMEKARDIGQDLQKQGVTMDKE